MRQHSMGEAQPDSAHGACPEPAAAPPLPIGGSMALGDQDSWFSQGYKFSQVQELQG